MQPFDVQQQADAMYEALQMPKERRQTLLEGAARTVRENDVERWLRRQVEDLTRR